MPPPKFPLELLLMIARHIRDDHAELRYGDFNSFLQINRTLYTCLNRMLWEEAREHEVGTQRIFTHLIRTNNLAGLESFLELGADVAVHLPAFDFAALTGKKVGAELKQLKPTPLLVVTALNNVPLASLLLEKGAKVQYRDGTRGQFSPLHAARSAEMVQLLLDHNADPDFKDDFQRRPLHWYAIRHDISAMRAILQHGAKVNSTGRHDFAPLPLHEAVQRNLDTVELLVEHGADVRWRDYQLAGNTPLHLAAVAGKTDVVKFLVERWPEGLWETDYARETPLHWAAWAGKTDVVRFLVDRWPEGKEALNSYGQTPLTSFRPKSHLSDEENEDIIALLGGRLKALTIVVKSGGGGVEQRLCSV
jgi:hypothetical protein